MTTLFSTLKEQLTFDLSKRSDKVTVFVPHNDAFSALPWDTIDELLQKPDWTTQVLIVVFHNTFNSFEPKPRR